MATSRVTKRSVEAVPIPAGAKRAYLWDDQLKGFGVMVTPAGSRSYLVQYRIGGRGSPTRRYTIGKHGSPWTADKARERATDLLEQVRKKVDPMEADKVRLAESVVTKQEAVRFAFSTYADTFIKRHVEARGLRSLEDIRSVFRRDLKPYFSTKPITAIRRSDVQACLDGISERSGSAANKAHKWLRKMLGYAVNRGDLTSSPIEGMSAPHQETSRQRVLRGQELLFVWHAAGDMGEPWTAFVRMLLLTGQRLREVAGMRWEELDLAKAVWVIPAARTKNKRDHFVPLAPAAVSILKGVEGEGTLRSGVVFSTNGTAPISGFSKLKRSLDVKVQEHVAKASKDSGELPMPLEPWVFHDLRRSVGTGCQALGFPIEHTEAVLNHVSGKRGGLAAIYRPSLFPATASPGSKSG
ncbi:MAG: tyrosine-type recombinase/integrase [Sphingomicrobium sp.]